MGLHLAQEFILLDLAGGNHGGTQLHTVVGGEFELGVVKVIAVCDLETGLHLARFLGLGGELEGLFGFQQVILGQGGVGQGGE